MGIIFPDSQKNELEPGKIEVGMTESLNSNSFDLNSNGLNRKRGFGRSKNVENFGRASVDEERIIDKVREIDSKQKRHRINFARVLW